MQITRRQRQSGITMVESCCAMTIAAALVGAGVPSFKQTIERRSVEGIATQLATDIMYVRSEAVARNEPLRVSFDTSTAGSCYVVHSGSASDCSCSGDGPAVCADGAREMKTVFVAAGSGVRVQSNVRSMLFDPVHGTATLAGTVRVVGVSGTEIRQVVNILGRPRACSPGRSFGGYRAC